MSENKQPIEEQFYQDRGQTHVHDQAWPLNGRSQGVYAAKHQGSRQCKATDPQVNGHFLAHLHWQIAREAEPHFRKKQERGARSRQKQRQPNALTDIAADLFMTPGAK